MAEARRLRCAGVRKLLGLSLDGKCQWCLEQDQAARARARASKDAIKAGRARRAAKEEHEEKEKQDVANRRATRW